MLARAASLFARVPNKLPAPELLEPAEEFPYEILAEKARAAAATLEKSFREFGLNVRVVEIDTGPVITQFELELEAGLRLSKVSALADDLAIALRVPSVRIVAPIPGKNTVGVEVPNDRQVMVRLRELIESCSAEAESRRIPFFMGKDVSGRPLVVDLAKMPHLLIAGRTGTGKSVCLNALILSILMTRTPEQVRLLMIDPKMVELSPYMRVPHLMHPVITDMKKAEAVLAWAVDKMEERYDLLARCGVRHLEGYNKLGKAAVLQRLDLDPESEDAERIPESMPYIVIVADEMADLMMTSGKEVEGHIIRLAQKSRAVGIHLVLATQKPTVDVITGLIKSNLPARVSFQVASRVDSRVVLDEMGADKLLGNGDMLYLAPGTSHLHRAQGTYVSDEEVNKIIEFYGDQEPQYCEELVRLKTSPLSGQATSEALRERDELYEQAIEIVLREGRGSVSLLQRAMGIGYGRAARLVDYMAEDGIVGDYNGSQAREVLYTLEQWQALRSDAEMAPA
jgi:S-DNA-T family DNA segregation ATPase FtsK/SpoIIIE